MRTLIVTACGWVLAGVNAAHAQEREVSATEPVASESDQWIDHLHDGVFSLVWRSGRYVDRMFGDPLEEAEYQERVKGSITPAVFWDEFNGFDQKFRFRVKVPVPRLDERYDAFIGTFSRDEYVTEREQQSGAIARQHTGGGIEEDETLLGIRFREPKERRFEADAGLRLRSPIDPFVKVGYRYERGSPERLLFRWKETLFWQNSEEFGFTTRVDLERIVDDTWFVRWTGSGTLSEETEGVRGYSSLTAYRGFPGRRAVGMQIFTEGEFDAAVPLGEYGIRVAWRQSILRDWLVLEIRPSVTWPKESPEEPREASWGVGIGFEMFFGEDGFEARPATF